MPDEVALARKALAIAKFVRKNAPNRYARVVFYLGMIKTHLERSHGDPALLLALDEAIAGAPLGQKAGRALSATLEHSPKGGLH